MFLGAVLARISGRQRAILLACAIAATASSAWAQDTRKVTEPVIPGVCVRLEAKIVATGDQLAEADEARADTSRIQGAIDTFGAKCRRGMAVELAPGSVAGGVAVHRDATPAMPPGDASATAPANAFLSGPLELREGVTLLVDQGVTLFASRRASDYDNAPGTCGTMPAKGGCKPFIRIRAKDAAIMGDGVIDGRGGARLLDKDYSWWALAVKAEPGNVGYSDPRLIDAAQADGLVLYRITLHNAANFHVGVSETNGFTAWGVHLKTPTVEPGPDDPRPRNTDGIDPGSSSNITIAHSWIDNGDDNIAIKTGVTHMSVLDNHFYSGHGMSIGSDTYTGDSFLLVDGLTENHTTSGIRIKSNVTRGGSVHDMVYRNICMRDVEVPIAISPYYNNGTIDQFVDPGFKGDRIPDYKKIAIEHVLDMTPGDVLIAGYDEAHRTEVSLVDVRIDGISAEKVHLKFADIGDGGTNIPLEEAGEGKNVTIEPVRAAVRVSTFSCNGKFLPMR